MEAVSIIIPAYNEELAIGGVLDALKALGLPGEIIVVDDASTDATADVAREHGVRVIRRPANGGYGRSVKEGIAAMQTDVVVLSDADGTYPIDKIPALLERFFEGFDMVVGARQGKAYRGNFFKMPARRVLKALVQFTTGDRIPDVNSGLRAFRKRTVERYLPEICNGFSFTTTITLIYLLTGKSVAYMPIPYEKRIGKSKVRHAKDSLRTLQYIVECIVRYNPLKIFLGLTLFILAAGLIGMIWAGPLSAVLGVLTAGIVAGMGLLAESMRRSRS
jgi:polyisoprenyl-phosphate glycosyltransferase